MRPAGLVADRIADSIETSASPSGSSRKLSFFAFYFSLPFTLNLFRMLFPLMAHEKTAGVALRAAAFGGPVDKTFQAVAVFPREAEKF